jgi:cellulose synthase/poly-beta-1,6-N-acetylglucosamine synthase-like glycosyltransferase
MRFSFVVPFHSNLSCLAECLSALDPLPPQSELIVVADGAREDCRSLAALHGARVVAIDGPQGPAAARNAAAAVASGEILVFVDADVVVSRSSVERMAAIFREHPDVSAAFGAYDEHPTEPGFMSQYKNLSHSFIHQSSAHNARTFWAGFGAVRREAFHAVGGFDERFERPSVEDIDFGYRLTGAGYQVMLEPTLAARHLKRWTLGSVVATDIFDRGIPWTQLILRYGAMRDDMNLRIEHRFSIVLAYLTVASLVFARFDSQFLANLPLLVAGLTLLNQRYYRFFYRKRGALFTARVWALHGLHHLYNGVAFAAGITLFAAVRGFGLRLPGALPVDAWSTELSQTAAAKAAAWSPDPAAIN